MGTFGAVSVARVGMQPRVATIVRTRGLAENLRDADVERLVATIPSAVLFGDIGGQPRLLLADAVDIAVAADVYATGEV